MLEGKGMSTKELLIILNKGWDLRMGVVIKEISVEVL